MKKEKILIIEKSGILRTFLKEKLESYNIEVILSQNGFDGIIKMKNTIPDLIIIDYYLTLDDKIDFLKEMNYPTIKSIPKIMLASKVDMKILINAAKYKLYKFFSKPININVLLEEISKKLTTKIPFDNSPCLIDVNLNKNILFIDISKGFNIDKIESLKYKILEIRHLFHIHHAKVLIIMSDITISPDDYYKMVKIIDIIFTNINSNPKEIKILTKDTELKDNLKSIYEYQNIDITDDIDYAMDKLSIEDMDELLEKNVKNTNKEIIFWNNKESANFKTVKNKPKSNIKISIIDDDELILKLMETILSTNSWDVNTFQNGNDFLDFLKAETPDILFLDLLMPVINGFEILEYLKKKHYEIPTIIFSSISQRETVKKTIQYGIKSYIVKPINPDTVVNKVKEILQVNI